MDKELYMKRAIALAVENVKRGGGPFGAVIVKDDRIIAEGVNRVTSQNDPTAHAEIQAIRSACSTLHTFDLSGCEIYSSCEPCPMCLGAIYWAHLGHLYFAATKADAAKAGFDDAFIYRELPLEIHSRALPTDTMLHDEAQEPFEQWGKTSDKIEY